MSKKCGKKMKRTKAHRLAKRRAKIEIKKEPRP
jgi:hypothetical protein